MFTDGDGRGGHSSVSTGACVVPVQCVAEGPRWAEAAKHVDIEAVGYRSGGLTGCGEGGDGGPDVGRRVVHVRIGYYSVAAIYPTKAIYSPTEGYYGIVPDGDGEGSLSGPGRRRAHRRGACQGR